MQVPAGQTLSVLSDGVKGVHHTITGSSVGSSALRKTFSFLLPLGIIVAGRVLSGGVGSMWCSGRRSMYMTKSTDIMKKRIATEKSLAIEQCISHA